MSSDSYSTLVSLKHSSRYVYGNVLQLGTSGGFSGGSHDHPMVHDKVPSGVMKMLDHRGLCANRASRVVRLLILYLSCIYDSIKTSQGQIKLSCMPYKISYHIPIATHKVVDTDVTPSGNQGT